MGAPCLLSVMEEATRRHISALISHEERVVISDPSSYLQKSALCCVFFAHSSEGAQQSHEHTHITLTNPYRKLPTISNTLHRSSGALKDVFVHLFRTRGMHAHKRAYHKEGNP